MNSGRFFVAVSALLVFAGAGMAQSSSDPELQRARELSEIKWTPVHDIQLRGKKETYCRAGVEQTGIIYSSAALIDRFVPYDVSLYTFLTCVHNPYSALYTECLNPKYPRSAYGIKYNCWSGSGPWMGVVCSVFSSYAAGFQSPVNSRLHATLCEEGVIEKIADQSSQGVELYDILWWKGHNLFVTGVTRAADAVASGSASKGAGAASQVVSIEISQSVSPSVIRTTYSAEAFDSLKVAKEMVIYRRADMSGQGQPPVYEMPSPLVYNDAICTYAGDRACFSEGELIVIHCLDRQYKKMELYKDGRLISVIPLEKSMLVHNADLGIRGGGETDPGAYAVNLSGLDLKYGMYKARLVNSSSGIGASFDSDARQASAPTDFEILDTRASCKNGILHFHSENGTPIFYRVDTGLQRLLSADDVSKGSLDVALPSGKKHDIRVWFQGRFGRRSTLVTVSD